MVFFGIVMKCLIDLLDVNVLNSVLCMLFGSVLVYWYGLLLNVIDGGSVCFFLVVVMSL